MNYEERINISRNYGTKFKGVLFRISAARSLTPTQNLCLVSIVDAIRERQDGVLLAISKISETYSLDEDEVHQGIASLIKCGYLSQFKFREDSGYWTTRYRVNTYAKTFYEQSLEAEEREKEERQQLERQEEVASLSLKREAARDEKRSRFFRGQSDQPERIFKLMRYFVDLLLKSENACWQGKRPELLSAMNLESKANKDFAKALKALRDLHIVHTEKAIIDDKKQSYLSYTLTKGGASHGL